jgi:DNA gyrase subunit A
MKYCFNRGSKKYEEAREKLIERFKLPDIQARAIVEMRLTINRS